MSKIKWCVKTKSGRIISHHFKKSHAQKEQLKSGKAYIYVVKCKRRIK